MKIMWWDFKKLFRVVSEMTKCAKNHYLEESCTLTGGEKSGWVSRSQERKYTILS